MIMYQVEPDSTSRITSRIHRITCAVNLNKLGLGIAVHCIVGRELSRDVKPEAPTASAARQNVLRYLEDLIAAEDNPPAASSPFPPAAPAAHRSWPIPPCRESCHLLQRSCYAVRASSHCRPRFLARELRLAPRPTTRAPLKPQHSRFRLVKPSQRLLQAWAVAIGA